MLIKLYYDSFKLKSIFLSFLNTLLFNIYIIILVLIDAKFIGYGSVETIEELSRVLPISIFLCITTPFLPSIVKKIKLSVASIESVKKSRGKEDSNKLLLLKRSWPIIGIALFVIVLAISFKFFSTYREIDTDLLQSLANQPIFAILAMMVYLFISLVYVISKKYDKLLKKIWIILGILIAIFNLILYLGIFSAITSEDGFGGFVLALAIGFLAYFSIGAIILYVLLTLIYWLYKFFHHKKITKKSV